MQLWVHVKKWFFLMGVRFGLMPVLSVPGQLADAGDEGIGSACNTLHRSSNRLLGGECHNIPAESLPVCCIVDIFMGRGPGHAPYRLRLDPA